MGFLDSLRGVPADKSLRQLQAEDLEALAQLIIQLACMNLQSILRPKILFVVYFSFIECRSSLEFVGSISLDLKKVVHVILSHCKNPSYEFLTVFDVSTMVHHRLLLELQNSMRSFDSIESELFKEYHNGRIARLAAKLNQVVDRPNMNGDRSWSDHPHRFLLKLFRDFVFHQVHEDGSPNIDIGHVIQSLDKLDYGSPEKIMLIGSNEKHVMIVSFFEIRNCLHASYKQLSASHVNSVKHEASGHFVNQHVANKSNKIPSMLASSANDFSAVPKLNAATSFIPTVPSHFVSKPVIPAAPFQKSIPVAMNNPTAPHEFSKMHFLNSSQQSQMFSQGMQPFLNPLQHNGFTTPLLQRPPFDTMSQIASIQAQQPQHFMNPSTLNRNISANPQLQHDSIPMAGLNTNALNANNGNAPRNIGTFQGPYYQNRGY